MAKISEMNLALCMLVVLIGLSQANTWLSKRNELRRETPEIISLYQNSNKVLVMDNKPEGMKAYYTSTNGKRTEMTCESLGERTSMFHLPYQALSGEELSIEVVDRDGYKAEQTYVNRKGTFVNKKEL